MSGNSFGTLYCVTLVRRVARPGLRRGGRRLSAGLGACSGRHPKGARPAKAGHVAPRHAAARVRRGRDPLRRVRGPHHRHRDRLPDPQRGPALEGLRGDRAKSSGPAMPTTRICQKYGVRDPRGGGRASARETVVRVAAGAIAKKWLSERYGVLVRGYLAQLGPHKIDFESWEAVEGNPFFAPDAGIVAQAREVHGRAARKRRFVRRARQRGGERRAGRLGRAGLRTPRRRHRGGDDGRSTR